MRQDARATRFESSKQLQTRPQGWKRPMHYNALQKKLQGDKAPPPRNKEQGHKALLHEGARPHPSSQQDQHVE